MYVEAFDLASIFRRIRSNVGILIGGTGIATLLNFGAVALNARTLGAEGLGLISLFQASAAILIGLFSFGSQQPLITLARRAIEESKPERIGEVATIAIMVDILAAVLAGSSGLAIVTLFHESFGLAAENLLAAKVYVVAIFLSGTAASNGVFRLLGCFYYVSLFQVTAALMTLSVSVALFTINAPVQLYIIGYAIIFSLNSQLQLILALVLLWRNGTPASPSISVLMKSSLLSEFFSYAWTTNAIGVIGTIRANADVMLLGVMFGTATAGIYSAVRQLTGVLNKISSALNSAVFPEIAALGAARDNDSANTLRRRLSYGGLCLGMSVAIAALLGGKRVLIFCFGQEFGAGYYPLALMLAASAIMMSGAFLSMFVQIFKGPRALFSVYLAAFSIFCLTSPALVLSFDVIGASIGQIVFAVVLWVGCWRLNRNTDGKKSSS